MEDKNFYRLITSRFPTDMLRPLIIASDLVYSWADMERESARFAAILTAVGCVKGDRIAVQVDKSPVALFLYLACLRAGLVFLPINTAYRAEEVDYLIGDSEPTIVIVSPLVAEVVAAYHSNCRIFTLSADGRGSLLMNIPFVNFKIVSCACDDIAAIIYTSGTTGRPKGAMLSHHNLAANGEALRTSWAFTAEDVLLHALPIFHAHGLFVACHCVLLSGGCMIWLPTFDRTQVLAHLPQATVFMGVPTYYTRLLAGHDLTMATCAHMRLFISGSAPLLPETFLAFQRRTGHAILERYGMTETGMNTSNPYKGKRQPGCVGRPLPGVSVRVTGTTDSALLPQGQTGVLQVCGDNVFLGYWRQQDRTVDFTSDGWFITGDLAYIEEDGTVTLVGRVKDLIISGGYNIYPREVEQVIDSLNGVVESAVIGLPHPDLGEAAVVVIQTGLNCPTAEVILYHTRVCLANYKVPKAVVFVDELPRNATGKVQKNVLRKTYALLLAEIERPFSHAVADCS